MKRILTAIALILPIGLVVAFAPSGSTAAQNRARAVVQQHVPRGEVVRVQVNKLRKFPAAVHAAPSVHPPDRAGFHWRWHPHYGWMSLPVAVAPQSLVLPLTYQLPPQVQVFQVAPQPSACACPYCWHPLTIQ